MKMDFPAGMPVHEQLIRSAERKRVGRKHNHTVGPTRRQGSTGQGEKSKAAWRKFAADVRAYFLGQRDTYPAKPTIAR